MNCWRPNLIRLKCQKNKTDLCFREVDKVFKEIFSQKYGIMIRNLWLRIYQCCTFDGVETILYDLRQSYCVPVTHK